MDRYYKVSQKFPDEEHCYDYPEYLSSLNIKNMFIAEEFAKPENYALKLRVPFSIVFAIYRIFL